MLSLSNEELKLFLINTDYEFIRNYITDSNFLQKVK